ncbi:MAG: isoprenylcysteine carboxylmethyltransferase family protein [Planctomycetes bacterium]|nr:isoprenylcysteine carboxylmethyltransferase family protein [Planctomycetota bacterium]
MTRTTTHKIGGFIFRARPLCYLLIYAPMFFISWRETENPLLTWTLGLALLLIAGGLRFYSVSYLGEKKEKSRRLLSINGPYRHVRNPLYVANLIGGIGACVVFKLFWYLPICLLGVFLVHQLILVWYEEKRMVEKFGDAFNTYKASVSRWWPSLKPAPLTGLEIAPKSRTPWGKVWRGELGTVVGLAIIITLAWLKGQI